jgi:hypothetical protein
MLAVMSDRPDLELPDGWTVKQYQLTGHFKLYAVFRHEGTDIEAHVVPYKTYKQPGFRNAHRVTTRTPENGLEVVAEGMEVEHVEEAESAAIEAMQRIDLEADSDSQSEASNKNDQ